MTWFSQELLIQGRRLLRGEMRRLAGTDSCRRFRGGASARKGSSILAGDTGANAELSFADAEATRRSRSHSNQRSSVLDGVHCLEDQVCRQSVGT